MKRTDYGNGNIVYAYIRKRNRRKVLLYGKLHLGFHSKLRITVKSAEHLHLILQKRICFFFVERKGVYVKSVFFLRKFCIQNRILVKHVSRKQLVGGYAVNFLIQRNAGIYYFAVVDSVSKQIALYERFVFNVYDRRRRNRLRIIFVAVFYRGSGNVLHILDKTFTRYRLALRFGYKSVCTVELTQSRKYSSLCVCLGRCGLDVFNNGILTLNHVRQRLGLRAGKEGNNGKHHHNRKYRKQ